MPSPLPPECAARFRPLQRLAAGGYGTVWLALQAGLERQVALKVLHREAIENAEALERFRNEARLTAGLRHPNIVVVLDHGIEDGVPWIAYEYVPGRTLRDEMPGKPMRLSRCLRFAAQVAAALEEAHRHGVLHRDIKPENLLVPRGDEVKVADFGLARRTGTAGPTSDGLIVGTPGYIAPERIVGQPATPAGDVYAVGVLVYEMLTGVLPFSSDTPLATFDRQVREDPPPPSALCRDLPAEVDRLVLAAMARDPRQRVGSAGQLKERIEALCERFGIDEEASEVKPSSPRMRTVRQERPTRGVKVLPRAGGRRPSLSVAGKARPVLLTVCVMALLAGAVGLTREPRDARVGGPEVPGSPRAVSSWSDPLWKALEADLEPVVRVRAARKESWEAAPEYLSLDISHAETALALARQFEKETSQDLKRLVELSARAQALDEASGMRTPGGRVVEARIRAHHFMLEFAVERNRIVREMLEGGKANTPADFMQFLVEIEGRRISQLMVGRLHRATVSYLSALELVCASAGEAGEYLPVLFEDLRWVSYWLHSAGLMAAADPGISPVVRGFTKQLERLSGPVQAPAGRAARGMWNWMKLGSRSPDGRKSLEGTIAAVEGLARAVPRARAGLKEMAERMRGEIAEHLRVRQRRR